MTPSVIRPFRMRRAVILTGALRTIKKTMKYFRRNVLLEGVSEANGGRDEVDVFVCVQHEGAMAEGEWEAWFRLEMGSALVSFTWFSLDRFPAWVAHRELQLEHLPLDAGWKGYLRNSGSMIEYFQLQLAYMKMVQRERERGVAYDYVVRARTDSIYAKPVDFHWLDWTEEEVGARMAVVEEEMRLSQMDVGGDVASRLKAFLCTVWSDDLIPMLAFLMTEYVPSPVEREVAWEAAAVRDYLHRGRYILTIRKNNLYVVRRELFHLIPTLGTMYGFMRSPISDAYWFNAEGQFRDACYYSGVSLFEYSSAFEEKSLAYAAQWNEADFFDLQGECVNPRMVYCVVRK